MLVGAPLGHFSSGRLGCSRLGCRRLCRRRRGWRGTGGEECRCNEQHRKQDLQSSRTHGLPPSVNLAQLWARFEPRTRNLQLEIGSASPPFRRREGRTGAIPTVLLLDPSQPPRNTWSNQLRFGVAFMWMGNTPVTAKQGNAPPCGSLPAMDDTTAAIVCQSVAHRFETVTQILTSLSTRSRMKVIVSITPRPVIVWLNSPETSSSKNAARRSSTGSTRPAAHPWPSSASSSASRK